MDDLLAVRNHEFSSAQVDAILDTFFGKKLGNGGSRSVFELYFDPTKVIKIEHGPVVQNAIEYELWCQHSEVVEAKLWLAECHARSNTGQVLIQERLEIITSKNDKRLPAKIPSFLTDTKVTNWGVDAEGNVKCCDYGFVLMAQNRPWKLKKAKWWEA